MKDPRPETLFVAAFSREAKSLNPFVAARTAEEIMRLGRKYCRLQTSACNGEVADIEKKRARIEAAIADLCTQAGKGIAPIFSGDPRGATVKLSVPSGYTDDWGGVGVCVPGS